jgi:hypothetical protein
LRFGTQQYRTDFPQKWDDSRVDLPTKEMGNYRPEAPLIVQRLKSKNSRRIYFEKTKKSSNFIRIRKNNIFYKYGGWEFVNWFKLIESIIELNQTIRV